MSNRKIICVGFQKTGTSSLTTALRQLGFSVGEAYSRINAELDPLAPDARETVERITTEVLAEKDAIQDSPCPFVFEQLDRTYPGSKFILTWRDTESWYRSFNTYFPVRSTPLRHWMYGVPAKTADGTVFKETYVRQNTAIRDYFRDRPDDLLELNLAKGDGWLELVNFLAPTFALTFPREKVGVVRKGQRNLRR